MAKETKMLGPKVGQEQFIRQSPANMTEATVGMKVGEERTGFLGGGNILRKPDYAPEPENLDAEGEACKRAIREILGKHLIPNELSSKSTPERDKRSLVGKLRRLTLNELKRFLPDQLKRMDSKRLYGILEDTEEITDSELAEIQDNYKEISP